MKQENILFFILLVAAAIVLGTTIGIINNMHYLVKHKTTKPKTSQAAPVIPAESKATTTKVSAANNNTGQNNFSDNQATQAENDEAGRSNHILTPSEVTAIKSMLNELGYNDSTFGASVRAFQDHNHLTTNGVLDSTTIDRIIQELTLKKARELAS